MSFSQQEKILSSDVLFPLPMVKLYSPTKFPPPLTPVFRTLFFSFFPQGYSFSVNFLARFSENPFFRSPLSRDILFFSQIGNLYLSSPFLRIFPPPKFSQRCSPFPSHRLLSSLLFHGRSQQPPLFLYETSIDCRFSLASSLLIPSAAQMPLNDFSLVLRLRPS